MLIDLVEGLLTRCDKMSYNKELCNWAAYKDPKRSDFDEARLL